MKMNLDLIGLLDLDHRRLVCSPLILHFAAWVLVLVFGCAAILFWVGDRGCFALL